MSELSVRKAVWADIDAMVSLAQRNRVELERAQPVFWKRIPNAETATRRYYRLTLLLRRDICLVAALDGTVRGFLIAKRTNPPPVYAPPGATWLVDDFHVAESQDWSHIGAAILEQLRSNKAVRDIDQIIVISAAFDREKIAMLENERLTCASGWWVGPAKGDRD